ncbi:MAG TPA: leucyl aminopeptidase, partial [Rhodobiaceae bacterium]|nr:leucyl aminopeptidase [Rhodobiaceae bacterium]
MNVTFADFSLPKTGAVAVFAVEGKPLGGRAAEIDKKTGGALKRAIKGAEFKGTKGQMIDLIAPKGISAARVVLVGLGKP